MVIRKSLESLFENIILKGYGVNKSSVVWSSESHLRVISGDQRVIKESCVVIKESFFENVNELDL